MKKFKVLDKDDNQIYDVVGIHFREGSVTYNYRSLGSDVGLVIEKPFNKVELLECAGLSDPKGKEIYESFIMNNDCVACYDRNQGKWKAVPFSTYLANSGLGGWTGYDLHSHIGEVIGNVYENKELLNLHD